MIFYILYFIFINFIICAESMDINEQNISEKKDSSSSEEYYDVKDYALGNNIKLISYIPNLIKRIDKTDLGVELICMEINTKPDKTKTVVMIFEFYTDFSGDVDLVERNPYKYTFEKHKTIITGEIKRGTYTVTFPFDLEEKMEYSLKVKNTSSLITYKYIGNSTFNIGKTIK
ncbi:hypothetical protein EHP00_1547 [Ecytonucleospora hepatopenaei]|uniref:DUF4352 domain-containing protein n=1 Tax=Ecytonucleospora hepatopenaei TaxID=646526 RepID=A0A1W0E7D7_9MICR|nr:hypothetical protein EHP00_1547 [Ecytonucleospora hepatopenaei]